MFRETTGAALEKALEGLALRHQALVSNIANVETPGYRPRRVLFEAALRRAVRAEQQKASGTRQIEDVVVQQHREAARPGAVARVDLETEMTALAITSAHHETLIRVAIKRLRMLRSAITGGGQP